MKSIALVLLIIPMFAVYFWIYKYIYNYLGIFSPVGNIFSAIVLILFVPLSLLTTKGLIKLYTSA